MKYIAFGLAAVATLFFLDSKRASAGMAGLFEKFGGLIGPIAVLAIVGVAFSFLGKGLGGEGGSGGGGGGKKKK